MTGIHPPHPAPSRDGERIIVTGAASGIGRTIADSLHRQGVEVIGLDRHGGSGDYRVLTTDLSDPVRISETVASLDGTFTGLCNAAGVPGTADWQTILRVNVLGLRQLTESLLGSFTGGAGVVNIASQAGYQVAQDTTFAEDILSATDWQSAEEIAARDENFLSDPYGFSKHVVHRLSVRWAAAWMPHGIRSVSLSPGPVHTPIAGDFRSHMGAERYDAAVAATGRLAEPADVADVACFLLSPAARWINGVDIAVDGGLSAVRAASTTSVKG